MAHALAAEIASETRCLDHECSVCEAEVLRDSVRRVQSGPGPPVKLRHTAKVLKEPSRGRAEEQPVVGGRESDEYTSRPVR